MSAVIGVDKPVRHMVPLLRELRYHRIRRKISQEALAQKAGVSESMISMWECGRSAPGLYNLTAWANTLGYDLVLVPRR